MRKLAAGEKLLTINEVAELLGYKKLNPLYCMVHRRQIPFIRLGKRILRFRLSDIEAYIESRKHGVETPAPKQAVTRRGRPRKGGSGGNNYINSLVEAAKK